jgi:N-acetylneuraminic acid mutarotase
MKRYLTLVLALLAVGSLFTSPAILSDEGEWSRRADMPTIRGWFGTATVNGRIYAIGGIRPPNITTVEEYDPQTDTWTRKADMPTKRDGLSAIALNGKIYAIGGLLEDWDTTGPVLPTVEEYNPATDTWTKKADMPYPRSDFSISVVNGKIYIFGGVAAQNWATLAAVEEYDPVTDTWTRKADMPTPRSKLAEKAPAVNGRIYVIGGTESYTAENGMSTVEEYDPAADTWTKKADMPTARLYLALSEVNGKIYAIGGERSGRVALQTVEEYDPVLDTWARKPDMPTARLGAAASSIDGRIYVIGGWDQTVGLSTVEAYDTGVREDTGAGEDTGPSLPWIHVVQPPPIEGSTMGGEPIAIFGEGFTSVIDVTIGGNSLTQMEITDTLITGLAPPGTEGEWAIVLLTPRSDYSVFAGKFIYKTPSDVVVVRITPTNGKLAGGDKASITGSGFLPGAAVTIGGNPATNLGITPTLVSFTIPAGTEGAKDVIVANPDGQKATLYRGYTYNPFPVIKRVEPRYGGPLGGGTEITITGSNFMEGAIVTIGENRGYQLALFSSTELRLRVPPGTAGPKPVRVVNPDGQEAILEDGFTYNPAPTITSVSPNAGPLEGGTPITITGTGFLGYASVSVLIGGAEATRMRVLPTQIEALTPPSDAGVKDVTVVNPDGQRVTLKDAFTYNTAPVIARVIPDNGRLAGGTRITVQGSSFLPGAKVLIRIEGGNYREALSSEVMSSSVIMTTTPPGSAGPKDVIVLNSDGQEVVLPEGFTYNPIPTIARLIPNHGPSSGGATITVEGTGFLLGARVMIGEKPATTMVRDDMTIEAVAPPNPQGVWDVKVVNPDTQEVVKPGGFVSVGEVAYNYPNPFHASQGTTFRYVTKDPVLSVTVKIFNMRGRPIGAARQLGSNEVKWVDPDVYAGLYIYLLEAELEGGKRKQVRNVMEVVE